MSLHHRVQRYAAKAIALALVVPVLIACDGADTISNPLEVADSIGDTACSNIAQMYGDWDVALLFDPEQPTSDARMTIDGDGDTVTSGSFYETSFSSVQITALKGYFIIAAATSDNSGEYIHMARYDCQKDRYKGQTWSRGRNFLMSWTAKRG